MLITENSCIRTRICTYARTVVVAGIIAHACSYTRTGIVPAISTMIVRSAIRSSVLHERENLDEGEKAEANPREGNDDLKDAALEASPAEEARRPLVL